MPVDPNAPVPSDAPIYAEPPDLQVSREGHTVSPRHPKEKIWTSDAVQADEAGDEVFRWAYFNRFEVDTPEVENTEWRPAQGATPRFRTVPVGNGMCQQEQASVEEEYTFKFALLKQYYEQWVTDTALKEYYDTLLGVDTAIAGGGLGVAGLFGDLAYGSVAAGIEAGTITTTTGTMAGAGAAGTLGVAGGTLAVGASFTTAFLGTTAMMSKIVKDTDIRSSGWAVMGKWKYDEAATGKTRTTWTKIGEPFPCPQGAAGTENRVGGDAPTEPRTAPRPSEADSPMRTWLRYWWVLLLVLLVVIALIAVIAAVLPRLAGGTGESSAPTATEYSASASCASATHSPHPLFPGSPSWWLLVIAAAAQNGALQAGTTFEAATPGADVPSVSGVVSPEGAMVAAVPISSYGDYAAGDILLTAPDGTVATIPSGSLAIAVDADEQSLACTGDADAQGMLRDAVASVPLGADAGSAFAADYLGWHDAGDTGALLASLHPAVLARYGEDQCRAYLDDVVGTVTELEVVGQTAEPWDYPLDGMTAQILDSTTLQIDATLGGEQVEAVPFHIAPYDGTTRWFTDCGDPVA